MVDSSVALDDNDYEIMELIKDKKVLVILNKADLAQVTTAEDIKKIINCGDSYYICKAGDRN